MRDTDLEQHEESRNRYLSAMLELTQEMEKTDSRPARLLNISEAEIAEKAGLDGRLASRISDELRGEVTIESDGVLAARSYHFTTAGRRLAEQLEYDQSPRGERRNIAMVAREKAAERTTAGSANMPAISNSQLDILKKLVSRSSGRTDAKIPLAEFAPALDIKSFAGGARFVDKDNPQYEGGSDTAYHYNTLRSEGLILIDYMTVKQSSMGGQIKEGPAVRVTREGFQAVAEANKRWIQKASNREIVIFGITVITAIAGGISYIRWNDIVHWIKETSRRSRQGLPRLKGP